MMIICNSSGSTSRNDSATRGTTTTTNYSQHAESRTAKHAGVNSQWLCHERGVDPTSIVSGKEESSSSSQFLTEYEIKYFYLSFAGALHAAGIMYRDVKSHAMC